MIFFKLHRNLQFSQNNKAWAGLTGVDQAPEAKGVRGTDVLLSRGPCQVHRAEPNQGSALPCRAHGIHSSHHSDRQEITQVRITEEEANHTTRVQSKDPTQSVAYPVTGLQI